MYFTAKQISSHVIKIPVVLDAEEQWKQKFEPVHEISNNVECSTSKASDQPAHLSI